ncbi:MAG: hypothetical protein JWO30_4962 [Fibrobacteres bacterium]|nr:hypothetical protein [Fibrobacterota bacterium]
MLRPGRRTARTLAALLCAVLMASLSVRTATGEGSGDYLDFKYMYYWDRNGVWNHTPAFDWLTFLSPAWSFKWSQEFDVVSGASRRIGSDNTGKLGDHGVDATSGASKRTTTGTPFANPWKDPAFDAVSGASKREIRLSENPGLTYSKNGSVYSGGIYYSDEPDYRSFSPSLTLSRDFNERNTTLSASGAWFFDDFHPQGAYSDQGGGKQIRSLTLSANQILTPLTMLSLTATGIYANGYLGHPYNPVILDSGFLIEERVPGDKTSWAVAAQLVQGYRLGGTLGSFHLQYRHYMDSWDLIADDAELQWYQYFGGSAYVRLRARGYAQGATAFYKDHYVGDESYRSVDLRYSQFKSLLLGIKVSAPLFAEWEDSPLLPDRFDLSYDFGIRDTYGDQGTDRPFAHYQLFPSSENYTEGTIFVGLGFDL